MPENPYNNSDFDQIIAVLEASGTNFKLSSPFYCCISKLKKFSLTGNQTRDLSNEKLQFYHWVKLTNYHNIFLYDGQ